LIIFRPFSIWGRGVFRAPTLLVSWKFSTGFSPWGDISILHNSDLLRDGDISVPFEPFTSRDILLSLRAFFMAVRKDIYMNIVFLQHGRVCYQSEPGFVLVWGCCDGRVKNCILRKLAF